MIIRLVEGKVEWGRMPYAMPLGSDVEASWPTEDDGERKHAELEC